MVASSPPPATRRPQMRAFVLAAAAMLPVAAALAAWLPSDRDARTWVLARALYWTMPLVLAAWLAAGIVRWRAEAASWRAWLRRNAIGLAVAALATVATFVLLAPAMRMQFDETSLVGAAHGMHRERLAQMATNAIPTATGPHVTDWNLDKRPPLFAFLVSVVHDLTGARVANAFAVNAALLFVLLALLACRARRDLGPAAAIAAPWLPLAAPIVPLCATSAGFELLATTLLAVVVLAAVDFLARPTAPRATWLLASGLVLAQARYESVFLFAATAALAVAFVRRWPRDRLGSWLLLAAPALLTPIALLMVHAVDPGFYPEARGQPLVAVVHAFTHLAPFLAAWAQPATTNAFPGALTFVSIGACVAWSTSAWREGDGLRALALVVAPVSLATIVSLAWFYGDVAEPTAVRLFLPAALVGTLGPLLIPHFVPAARAARVLAVALPVAALVLAAWRVRDASRETALPPQAAAVALEAVDAALRGLQPDPTRTLLVSSVAQYLIVRGHAAMAPLVFAQRAAQLPKFDVVVLQTPLDAQLGQAGDIQAILRDARATLLGRVEGDMPVAAWRLQR
jgi:hypothetical protein